MTERKTRGAPPSRSVEEALERARRHGLAALAESADAARALLDAASLATSGAPSDAHEWLSRASQWIDAAAGRARSGAGVPPMPWLDAVSDALDEEIERWETRSRQDPEARSVLRAFLGVREILWEFGLRARSEETGSASAPANDAPRADEGVASPAFRARPPRSARRGASRIQRVPVEG